VYHVLTKNLLKKSPLLFFKSELKSNKKAPD
jgi:hypothetical protein